MRRAGYFMLAASLVLNVFFLGLSGVIIYRIHQGALAELEFFFGRRLAAPDRALFDADLEAGRPGYIAALAPVIAAHRRVDETLRATPFDPAAYQAALETWRGAFGNFLASFEAPLVKAATDISPAGRLAIAAQGDVTAGRAGGLLNSP